MVHQRQYQQPTNGGAGSKAPLLVLGAAALMIQGLLVLPTSANKAETTINISSSYSNNNDASVLATSGNSKVSFDLGVHHNLQTIASLSTGGAGPASAGPQLWGTTFTAGMVSNSNNATTPANFQQGQEQEQDRQQKDALEGVSSALYRKIRLEEPSDAPATAVDSTAPMAASVKDVRVVGEVEDIQSGETEPEVDEDLEKEVASTEKESVSLNTDTDTIDAKTKDDSKDVAAVTVVEEESLSIILNPVALSTLSTVVNDNKKSKKITATEVEDGKTADVYDDDEDFQNDNDKTTAADETESETETETEAEADAGTPRVGDQVVLDKDGNLVKDITLESEAKKKSTDASSTTASKESKPSKPMADEEEEEEEEEEEKKEGSGDKEDHKGKKDEEDNAKDDKEAEEVKKDETRTVVSNDGKKKGHREQAFARLREQLVKQQQQQQQLSTGETDTTALAAGLDQTAVASTPVVEDGTTTLARAADFVPPEDMRAVMNAKAEKDKKENNKTQSPLTPQQIADTEHQGANAFFEQRLNKQKEDKKAKAVKKKQQQDKKDTKKVVNKKGGKKQRSQHQSEKRALFATAPEMTEKERVHAALENIFGKDGAAKIETEADDSTDVEITAQGLGKGVFATAGADADVDAAADAAADSEDTKIIDFDQDLDDEPIGILGAGKKDRRKKKHHHKHHAEAAIEGDATTVFTTGDDAKDKNAKDAKDTKDNTLTPPADSPMAKPSAGGPPERTVPGPSAGQPQPQQHQPQQPASGAASPASPPVGAPPAGAKGGPVTPSKGEAGTAGFGTVPMFGPAQLDLGNSAASLIASKSSITLALVFGVAWMVL
ncbi:hypothetical protein K457DRAFT_890954 [Linnemannia elongata AG-77]|uniref:Uncharacterized protein n=1 Tax=Linnemannia elongata AG-77 TaxID=1314771 RepID=A0A197KG23_9FUNG|nr:hypothetical protein K457DRAFT_890954 [Linnemannia elongata AG-77]